MSSGKQGGLKPICPIPKYFVDFKLLSNFKVFKDVIAFYFLAIISSPCCPTQNYGTEFDREILILSQRLLRDHRFL